MMKQRNQYTAGALACAIMTTFAVALSGCATRLSTTNEGVPTLKIQRMGVSPLNGGQLIDATSLMPGDIILSSASNVQSNGIQLLTTAGVSHASLYIGDNQVVEAVGSGVHVRSLEETLATEAVTAAFRHPDLSAAEGQSIRHFALAQVGGKYNYMGVMLHAPFSLQRRLCDLPVLTNTIRDACILGIAQIALGSNDDGRFFCSQLVVDAYAKAGRPITPANSRWVSPADLLHMREGDVPSIKTNQALLYVGHLKFADTQTKTSDALALN
jgi:uncharacterized protein YycO